MCIMYMQYKILGGFIMKKTNRFILCFTALFVLLSLTISFPVSAKINKFPVEYKDFKNPETRLNLSGDVNYDDRISAIDALIILQSAVGKYDLSDFDLVATDGNGEPTFRGGDDTLKRADCNENGRIDVDDALLTLQVVVHSGKITHFPGEQE